MGYDAEQLRIARRIIRIGRRRGESRREIKAALETGLVESGLRNLGHGDADSLGWRQERASLYPNPRNVRASINRFYDETDALDGQNLKAGQLAAAVQRPAAQYRGRYAQRSQEAKSLLERYGSGGAARDTTDTPTMTTSVDLPARRQALLQYLDDRDKPDALLTLGTALQNAVETHAAESPPSEGDVPSPGRVGKLMSRADRINDQHLPYKWGGGHGADARQNGAPLDCSGAVSKVLGIDPLVSGQFASWGRPGKGKRVTIYANAEHVLMEINGRFWGTSGSNPGGGAGWIPRSKVSAAYLSGFTARHPKGL